MMIQCCVCFGFDSNRSRTPNHKTSCFELNLFYKIDIFSDIACKVLQRRLEPFKLKIFFVFVVMFYFII